ncbi:MAG: DUF1579 family protein [Betaproteobacteria bacterium]|nr:DUF1579 family protein [Betaproteobacteria bacterium]
MSLPKPFSVLSGEWKGVKRLYLEGARGPEILCGMRLTLAAAARGCFDEFAYTWSFEGRPCEGVLLLGYDEPADLATAAWIDSWHQSARVMHLSGSRTNERTFSVRGAYAAPPGPDWGWRIDIGVPRIEAPDLLSIKMFNVSPEGGEELAVVMELERVD